MFLKNLILRFFFKLNHIFSVILFILFFDLFFLNLLNQLDYIKTILILFNLKSKSGKVASFQVSNFIHGVFLSFSQGRKDDIFIIFISDKI